MSNWSKPLVVARLNEGDVIQLLNGVTVKIITLSADYQRNSIAAFKTASVEEVATGTLREVSLYGNQRYKRIEGQEMSESIITTEPKTFEDQMTAALEQVRAEREAAEEKRRLEEVQRQTERIAQAKSFVDWLGLPGELVFDVRRDAPCLVYQGINFLLRSTMRGDQVFVKTVLFKQLPEDEHFKWDWQSCRVEIEYGWRAVSDTTRTTILAEFAEYIPRINSNHANEIMRYEAWLKRDTSAALNQPHTILTYHTGTGQDDVFLSKKLDEGYRIVSMSAFGGEDFSAAFILLSKMEHPVVRQRVLNVGDI